MPLSCQTLTSPSCSTCCNYKRNWELKWLNLVWDNDNDRYLKGTLVHKWILLFPLSCEWHSSPFPWKVDRAILPGSFLKNKDSLWNGIWTISGSAHLSPFVWKLSFHFGGKTYSASESLLLDTAEAVNQDAWSQWRQRGGFPRGPVSDPGVTERPPEWNDRHLPVCPLHLSDGPASGHGQQGVQCTAAHKPLSHAQTFKFCSLEGLDDVLM